MLVALGKKEKKKKWKWGGGGVNSGITKLKTNVIASIAETSNV